MKTKLLFVLLMLSIMMLTLITVMLSGVGRLIVSVNGKPYEIHFVVP